MNHFVMNADSLQVSSYECLDHAIEAAEDFAREGREDQLDMYYVELEDGSWVAFHSVGEGNARREEGTA